MKKIAIQKGSLILLFILAITQLQANPERKKTEYNRSFHESYSVNSDARLILETSFTDVEIINWDKDEIDISVDITINSRSESDAEKLFNKINIEMSGNSNTVNLGTSLKNGTNTNNIDWSIKAVIYAPCGINLDATMEFGNLITQNIAGNCNIHVEFGNIDGTFPSAKNDISIEYGNITAAVLGCKSVTVEFGAIEIGVLTSSCDISSDFSKVKIGAVTEQCDDLDISVEFGSLKLNLLPSSNFRIDASSSFGDIDFDGEFKIHDKDKGMFDLSYSASIGSGGGKINIDSSYSDINIKTRN